MKSLNDPVARFRVQEVDPVRHHNQTTFEWLFTDQVPFSRWLRDDRGEFDTIFWVTGKPGSGKSTLMRFALEDSRTMSLQPSNSKGNPMAYFFHLRGKSLVQKSLRGMLMELLYQLLEQYPRSFELIRPIFTHLRRLKQDWDIKSLSRAMLHIPHIPASVPGCRDLITIFVDALDENQNQDDNNNLLSIFDSLNTEYSDVRTRVDAPLLKICLASRPWPIFEQRLGHDPRVPSFAIHEFTTNDIRSYTNSRLLTTRHILQEYDERKKAISQLSAEIASRAKGVFIWVRVVVDSLRQEIIDGTPFESLQTILHAYPEELDDMYKFTLKRVRGGYRPETMIVLKVMLASRVPLTVLQLYTVTNICLGSRQSSHPTGSSDDVMSWLASRSGGLIDVVDTSPEERVCDALGGDAEKTIITPAPDSSVGPTLYVEFIHQTVQEFVRAGLDDHLESMTARKHSKVAKLSGSRLLAFACLDSHPPHPHLWNVSKDIFSYIREVEREEDETQSQQMTGLPSWGYFGLHDFPFRVRQPQGPPPGTYEMFSHYMDMENSTMKMIVSPPTRQFSHAGEIPKRLIPFVVVILNDLYHTKGPEHFSTPSPLFQARDRRLLLFLASVGPRLSDDRTDRPRMFDHIFTSYLAPPSTDSIEKLEFSEDWLRLPYKPINEPVDHVLRSKSSISLASILASTKPSTDLDDDALLSFTQRLYCEGSQDAVIVEVPEALSQGGPDGPAHIPRGVRMTLPAFCARFRDINRSKWVNVFYQARNYSTLEPRWSKLLYFVDLAAWDAMGREPLRHIYTDLAETGGVMPQAVASACMPAAVVGMGGGHIFQALYPSIEED